MKLLYHIFVLLQVSCQLCPVNHKKTVLLSPKPTLREFASTSAIPRNSAITHSVLKKEVKKIRLFFRSIPFHFFSVSVIPHKVSIAVFSRELCGAAFQVSLLKTCASAFPNISPEYFTSSIVLTSVPISIRREPFVMFSLYFLGRKLTGLARVG